jgi:primosomal protein N' (replication factor Y)
LLAEAVSPLPVFRLDSDSTARAGAHAEILSRFERSPAGVLVGTQMVAKGHDFADVELSVMVDADATLRFPDFRAEERTFALVAQLAGRSGRGARGGRVLVQTLAPGAAAIRHAARHDAPGFLTAVDPPRAEALAEHLRVRLEDELPADTQLLGPAPRFRLRGRHRRQLLVKALDRTATVTAVGDAVGALTGRQLRGVSLSVDVDPQ